tara:strand:+ start:226 stop:429 length:204 start_codon:yes stop_codon:yes gene_type:complete
MIEHTLVLLKPDSIQRALTGEIIKRFETIKNLIYASSNKEDAEREISLWFHPGELYSYHTVHDIHTL